MHANKRRCPMFLAMLALTLAGGVFLANAKTYFDENFRRYGEQAPGTDHENGIGVSNDPIWADMAEVQFRPVKDGLLFVAFQPTAGAPALKAFDLAFTFRFISREKGSFDLLLRDGKGQDLVLTFSRTEVTLTGKGVAAKGALPAELGDRTSCMTAVKVNNGVIDVYAEAFRVFHKVLTAKIPADGLAGFNFRGRPTIGFSITDIVLSDPAPLADFSAQKHFADFRSLRDEASFKSAKPLAEVTLTGNGDGVKFRPGNGGATLSFHWNNGQKQDHRIIIGNLNVSRKVPGLAVGVLTNSVIHVGKLATQHVQPLLRRYHSSYSHVPALVDILRDAAKLPKASAHPLDLDFQKHPDGSVDLYIDGAFIRTVSVEGAALDKITLSFPAPTPVVVKTAPPGIDQDRFVPIDLAVNPRAKAFLDARLSLKPGPQKFGEVPVIVAEPAASADVGICRQGMGDWALEVDEYLARSPLDGFPSAIHYRLPPALYTKAWVVCALDPDTAKDPVLVARLAHFIGNGSGGNMLSDTTLVMPSDGSLPPNMKEVGTVDHKGRKLPLYLLELPLNMGQVLDFASRRAYIDFELAGKQWINFEQIDRTMKPDPYSTSAFQIFGVTLEKAPVIMDMAQAQPGNVFTQDEQARTAVTLRSLHPAKVTLAWRATDADGMEVFTGKADAAFAKAGETRTIEIALKAERAGYYDLAITLAGADGKTLLVHPARFAIVPKDTRKANRYTSPYGTWWFGNSHGSVGDFEIAGPLLKKAGIRKCAWKAEADDHPEMVKYNLTSTGLMNIPLGMRQLGADGTFSEKDLADAEAKIQAHLKRFPKTSTVMIWHESAPGYGIPEELLELPVPAPTDYHKRTAAYVNACGKFLREKFSGMKIQLGNSSASIGAATLPLRNGAKPEYYDYIGIETPSQVICPEKLQEVGLQGLVISKDIASRLAGRPVAVNACWEYTYRCERDMGEAQQAEWYMRDILISLANEMTLIGPGIFFDCATGYGNGLWGGSGILTRGPYVYPKRAYVAYAALTAVLDQVKLRQQLPTGSTTAYALAFERADKQHATALWTARGGADFTVTFGGNTQVRVFDMYGRETRQPGASIVVKGGTSPTYLLTTVPVRSVAITSRTFPKDEARAAKATVAAALDQAEDLTVAPDPDFTVHHTRFLPIMKPSDFTVTTVTDEEKGDCVEVALAPAKQKETSKYVTEYTTLTLAEPKAVTGNPAAIGVWVKGNSNWGQIRFTIEDAEGEVFKSYTTSGWGCDILDWPGNLCVNFDGWSYVAHPLRETKLFNDHSPGPVEEQWVSSGGNKVIDLPVKVKAITVGMNRHKLDLLDFKDSAPSIRLRDAGGAEE
jgi:hypothetical protein